MSKRSKLFLKGMRRKTKIAYLLVVGVLVALTIRVVYINVANGKEYSEAVVLQMDYNSTDIPYERGEILDRNGNVLANSEKTYSLILEPVNILLTEKGKAATRAAVLEYFDVSGDDFDKHIANEDSYYEVVLKDLPYTKVKAFEDYCKTDEGADVIGVRFETVYKRNYPNGSLACHLLGYTASGNVGQGGIEGYYNDYLNGVDGKTYRYMSGSGGVDSETVAAQNGETVVSMDANMDAKHPDVPIINRYINNGRKYRANKKDIDDVVDKFENDIWNEYDKYTAELEAAKTTQTDKEE